MSDALLDDAPHLVERPQSYEDLRNRPDFQAPLDHKAFALKSVLTDYHFPKDAPCGLKSCRQPHQHGYLVLTDGGGETNIGNRCGKTHFGAEVFSSARADWVRRRDRDELVKRAKHLQSIAPDIEKAINDLTFSPFGGKWAVKVKTTMESVIGAGLVDSLRVASIRGDLAVIKSRRRSDEEIDDVVALNPGMTREKAAHEDVVIGQLMPMPWLQFDFRERLMVGLVGPLKSFRQLDADGLASPKLKAEVKRFDGHELILQQATEAAAAALRFLSGDNLRLVADWIPKHFTGVAGGLRSWIGGKEHAALLGGSPK